MASYFYQDLEQEPFSAEDFLERLAFKLTNGAGYDEEMDPDVMYDSFLKSIRELETIREQQEKKCETLIKHCHKEELLFRQRAKQLQQRNKEAFTIFQELDDRISFVATKVVHLGDQLESVNTPRSRAVEAQRLIHYFAEFLGSGPLLSEIFTDSSKLFEAADVIQKLYLISQELPVEKFSAAKERIDKKYGEIETTLIESFVKAHRSHNTEKMREIASILLHFKSYHRCVDAFIDQSQSQLGTFTNKDIFRDIVPLCESSHKVIVQVFSSPDQVMAKFVLNIYSSVLQKRVVETLSDKGDSEKYLINLSDLYTKTNQLTDYLKHFDMGSDTAILARVTNNIFHRYLESYISVEIWYLKERCIGILQRYYDSKHHQKRQLPSGGIHDFKREVQTMIGTKTNIIGSNIENFGGETFLSEEVALNILQETKMAFKRCDTLSRHGEAPGNAVQIFEVLVLFLLEQHIEYAIDLGMTTIPLPDQKSSPDVYFFDVVRQTNSLVHLFERQFADCLLPLIISTPKHAECLQKKKNKLHGLEVKLDSGIDRTLQFIINWVKMILQNEQKKTDFKPESELDAMNSTQACTKVVRFVSSQVEKIHDCLDGNNVEATLMELGTKLHRTIYDHLQQFQYSSTGAMCVICDVNEYRKCIQELKIPFLNSLFDILYALCNLLVVEPKNLRQICNQDQLTSLDRSVLLNFIQLRADYKTARLANQFKGWVTT